MAQQHNNHIRKALTSLFPAKRIRKLARECKAVHRQRKIDIVALVFSLVLGFASQKQRSVTAFRRAYEKATGTRIAASAFYDRFSQALVRLLRQMLLDSLQKASESSVRSTGRVLKKFAEVLAIDSTLIRLHNALEPFYPSVWTHCMRASAKLCMVMNVVTRGAKTVKITAGSRHDIKTIAIGPWVKKKLLIFDLGYFQGTLFELIDKHDGFFLCRMRKQVNPLILESHRPDGKRFVGMTLKEAKCEFTNDIVDFDVKMHYDHRRPRKPFRTRRYIRLRVIGVFNHDYHRYHFYITNLSVTKMKAEHIAAVYAARWEIELLFRELKSQYRIDQMPSKNRYVSEALIYSALLCLAVSRRLYSFIRNRFQLDYYRVNFDRWSILFSSICADLLDLLVGPKRYYRYLERRLTEFIRFEVQDPNVSRKTLIQKAQIGVL